MYDNHVYLWEWLVRMEQTANKYQTITLQLDSFEHSKYVNMIKTEKKKNSFTSAARYILYYGYSWECTSDLKSIIFKFNMSGYRGMP